MYVCTRADVSHSCSLSLLVFACHWACTLSMYVYVRTRADVVCQCENVIVL